jgi:hypothetical protein
MGEPKFQITACGSCQAAIIWAETSNGQSMPVDAAPAAAGGNVELSPRPGGGATARVLSAVEASRVQGSLFPEPDRVLRRSHFATCVNADAHRRPPVHRPLRAAQNDTEVS